MEEVYFLKIASELELKFLIFFIDEEGTLLCSDQVQRVLSPLPIWTAVGDGSIDINICFPYAFYDCFDFSLYLYMVIDVE